MLLRKHKSYIYIALVLFALASVALPKQAIAFEFSVPTEVNAVLMPDGAVVKSSFSTGTNTSEDPLAVSGDLSLNGGFKGSLIFNNQNNTKDIEVNVGDKIDGSIDITKIDNSLDYSKKNIIGSINWSIQPKIKTAFAIYSADDDSLNFYKRSTVPAVGSQFEGKTVTSVYTNFEDKEFDQRWTGTNTCVPWADVCSKVTNATFIDTIQPKSMAWWFHAMPNLVSVDFTNLDTSGCTSFKRMFSTSPKITDFIKMNELDTSSLKNVQACFDGCHKITTNSMCANWDVSNVELFGAMFYNTPNLTSFDASNWRIVKAPSTDADVSGVFFSGDTKFSPVRQISVSKSVSNYLKTRLFFNTQGADIPGADGKWYAISNGTGYAPENIPSNKADTYVASPNLLPKPEAFAVYSADDQSLNFYKRSSVPKAGEQFEGKTATEVYTGIEKLSSLFMPWSQHKTSITNSTVIDTIKPISTSNWFSNFTALTTADLSKMDTSATNNMQRMFFNCTSLTSLNLSGLDTSNVVLMSEMFNYCSSLTSLNLSSFNTSKVTNMREMFRGCRSLTSLDLSNFNTSKVTNMREMFQSCSNLTSIDLSSFNTSRVTSMEQMFSYCSSLTSLDLSHFNTSNVTLMDYMFADCSSLTSLNLSNFNTSKVTSMFFMFNGCSSLTTLDISMFDNHLVSEMSNMFNKCYKLQQIKLGNKFSWKGNEGYLPTPSSSYIPGADGKWYAMSDKKGYAPADIPSNKADTYVASPDLLPKEAFAVFSADDNSLNFYKRSRVPKAGEQFEGKTATEVYTGIETNEYIWGTNVPWYSKRTIIISSNVVDVIKPKSISNWFSECSSLTSLNLSHLNTSSVTNMDQAFNNCLKLTSLDLSNFNTSAVTSMKFTFNKCSSLTSLNLSNFNTSAVTRMDSMFWGCSSLISLNLSNFNTSAVTRMDNMFWGCSSLASLDLSSFNTSKVTEMLGMFANCSKLTSLNLSSFDTSSVTNISTMFSGCTTLTSLDLSNFDTSAVTNMSWMFDSCPKLQQVKLGNKFAWKGTNGYLPTPSSSYIPGADGKWYAMSNGNGYAPTNIPSNKADIYYASKNLLPNSKLSGNVTIDGNPTVGNTLTANVNSQQNDAILGYQWYKQDSNILIKKFSETIYQDNGLGDSKNNALVKSFHISKASTAIGTVKFNFPGYLDPGDYFVVELREQSSKKVLKQAMVIDTSEYQLSAPLEVGDYELAIYFEHAGVIIPNLYTEGSNLGYGATTVDVSEFKIDGTMDFEPISGETTNTLTLSSDLTDLNIMVKVTDKSSKYEGELASEVIKVE